ncbi:hypothetical protein RFM26_24580 [Mesorhizobium sp. VK23B]|uniref:DUF883 domain-containing protein n=1 Tax=Mesorhizobium dulcispinae TaxID=3072316 RepID=A0ABU4XKQ8_9HYPH|nr:MULTISPECIES: hypothetical protein [unclassified Mesorhizobium]MDX8468889.1 hypothetical protein [Mesorhizobium sp. VK23B]MDX8475322.1 hypothetical protein [Mesorhizobium sp. VK23A]
MADNDIGTAGRTSGNGKGTTSAARNRSAARRSASGTSEAAMKKQIAELKREVSRLNRMLSDQAEETAHGWYQSAADRASNLYSGATGRASRAARQLRSQAHSVSETVQHNPGTFSTAVALGGMVGVLVGLALAKSSQPEPDWFHRWHR